MKKLCFNMRPDPLLLGRNCCLGRSVRSHGGAGGEKGGRRIQEPPLTLIVCSGGQEAPEDHQWSSVLERSSWSKWFNPTTYWNHLGNFKIY